MNSADQLLQALAIHHFGGWNLRPTFGDPAVEELERINSTRRTIVILKVEGGRIEIAEKPSFFQDTDFRLPIDATIVRVLHYYRFLEPVIKSHFPEVRSLFAIELEDGHFPTQDVPIFAFQRPFLDHVDFGSNNVLLPDIDFLQHDFYQGAEHEDTVPFGLKRAKAIFVGSTTGRPINHRVIDMLELPRLRSAMFFRDRVRVDFRLPNIVMCETAEVAERLKQMGFGVGHCSWQEQLNNRFLISMDGNGATCSRIALALKSNSVLLKYNSVNQLFYFPLLRPWLHYVPIGCDQEVEQVLAMSDREPDLFLMIAEGSHSFYSEFLVRPQIERYCYHLLKRYFSLTASARLGDALHRFPGVNRGSLNFECLPRTRGWTSDGQSNHAGSTR